MDLPWPQWARLVPMGVELASLSVYVHCYIEFWEITDFSMKNLEFPSVKKICSTHFFGQILIGGHKVTYNNAFKPFCRMCIFVIVSEYRFSCWWFLVQLRIFNCYNTCEKKFQIHDCDIFSWKGSSPKKNLIIYDLLTTQIHEKWAKTAIELVQIQGIWRYDYS